MTEGLAIEIAKKKMQELGSGDNYLIRLRHIQLAPEQQLLIKGFNELLILIEPSSDLYVFSKAGIYDINDTGINEMQYIHRGETTLKNQNALEVLHVKLLQII